MKNLKKIEITTHKNGYSLTVGESHFMYFSLPELLDGFIYHVGLNELDIVENDKHKEIINAAIKWQDNGKNVKELLKYKNRCDMQERMIKNFRDLIRRYKNRMGEINDENTLIS